MRLSWRCLLPALLALSGCMFFRSLDDLTSGAGSDAGTGTLPDSGSGSGSEGGIGPGEADGAVDGGVLIDAAIPPDSDAGPFCANAPSNVFCEDFDGPSAGSFSDWTYQSFSGGLTGLDTTLAKSAPSSFGTTIRGTTSNCIYAAIGTTVQGPFTEVQIGFDVYFDPSIPPSADAFVNVAIGPDLQDTCQSVLIAEPNGVTLVQQTVTDGGLVIEHDHPHGGKLPAGEWVHIEFREDAAAQSATFSVNSGAAIAFPIDSCPHAPGNIFFNVGFLCEGANPDDRRMNIDNVYVQAR